MPRQIKTPTYYLKSLDSDTACVESCHDPYKANYAPKKSWSKGKHTCYKPSSCPRRCTRRASTARLSQMQDCSRVAWLDRWRRETVCVWFDRWIRSPSVASCTVCSLWTGLQGRCEGSRWQNCSVSGQSRWSSCLEDRRQGSSPWNPWFFCLGDPCLLPPWERQVRSGGV